MVVAKKKNIADSQQVTITVSMQSFELLQELARRGVYGRGAAEVAGRFVDEALQRFIEQPKLHVKLGSSSPEATS